MESCNGCVFLLSIIWLEVVWMGILVGDVGMLDMLIFGGLVQFRVLVDGKQWASLWVTNVVNCCDYEC